MMVPFERASYLAQVRRLRALAQEAMSLYPLRVETCRFLGHVENTTFQVTANRGKKFLLRIHRNGYHSHPAILEELHWLQDLSADPLLFVPRPIQSKRHQLLERITAPAVGQARYCTVLEWVDGRFIDKSLNLSHMFALGKLIGRLHKRGRGRQVVERRYWDAEGLVGTNAKLGSVEGLPRVSASDQKTLSKGRRWTYRHLKGFETASPHKQGLIHADLHFGNVLLSEGEMGAIDFDDCGLGFFAYDLAVPLRSVEYRFRKRRQEFLNFKAALIEGYVRESTWDDEDEKLLAHLMNARRLVMLGWLNSRSDNPKLRKLFRVAASKIAEHFRTVF